MRAARCRGSIPPMRDRYQNMGDGGPSVNTSAGRTWRLRAALLLSTGLLSGCGVLGVLDPVNWMIYGMSELSSPATPTSSYSSYSTPITPQYSSILPSLRRYSCEDLTNSLRVSEEQAVRAASSTDRTFHTEVTREIRQVIGEKQCDLLLPQVAVNEPAVPLNVGGVANSAYPAGSAAPSAYPAGSGSTRSGSSKDVWGQFNPAVK